MKEVKIIKKNGMVEEFNAEKIHSAIQKSAERVMIKLTDEEKERVSNQVKLMCESRESDYVKVETLHIMVEVALSNVNQKVSESYQSYRNYKKDFVSMLDEVYRNAQSILYVGDKENSNADSSLVSTKRSLIAGQLSKELYQKFFLTSEERQAIRDGFIYIHDMRDRLYCLNCCLADVSTVMKGGFEMGNIWYNEPKSVDTACDVLGDVIMSMASQQYGELIAVVKLH